jgi:NAD(P)H-hydrate epimerase
MSGAAVLAGTAALRGGAGLVEVATPAEVQPLVAMGNPCYLTTPLPADADGRIGAAAVPTVLFQAMACDVLALGPGLGLGDGVTELVRAVIGKVDKPVILDADAINTLAKLDDWPARPKDAPLILTPHPGEFGRLIDKSAAAVQAARETLAHQFAQAPHIILVLKGHETLVTDGKRLYQNDTGNPGMATGGTGDVLTGLIAALAAQELPPFEAAQLGVFLHGLAGDLARDDKGEVSLIATDLLDQLPAAFVKHTKQGHKSFGFRG